MITLACSAVLAITSTSFGAVTFLDQSRTIGVGRTNGPPITRGTTALGAYSDTMTSGLGAPDGGTATQASLLDPLVIAYRSTLIANDGLSGYVGYAESRLFATFRVDEPTPWSIVGSFWAEGIQGADRLSLRVALTRLDASSAVIFEFSRLGSFISTPGNFNAGLLGPARGILIPDRYRFEVIAISESRVLGLGGFIDSEANVKLDVPSPSAGLAIATCAVLARRRRRTEVLAA